MRYPISGCVRPGEAISSLCAWLCIALGVAAMAAGTGVRLEAQAETDIVTKQYAPSDIQGGARIYTAQCAACHGPNGDGVAKVDLRSGKFSRATSGDHLDDDLRKLISTGVSGTAMPPFKFDPAQLNMIVAYLRNMRDFNANPGSRTVKVGEALRGQAVFEAKGQCLTCHRVNGKGSRVGPDLSDIGGNRTAEALERSLLDPNASIQPVNRFVRAVTRDGKTVRGRRLNEDSYTVQIMDEQERLVSLVKADLLEYTVIKTSAMPSYKDTLSSDERADIIAYLLTLKGSQ
jgi:putative heme-binding domain-containing protein